MTAHIPTVTSIRSLAAMLCLIVGSMIGASPVRADLTSLQSMLMEDKHDTPSTPDTPHETTGTNKTTSEKTAPSDADLHIPEAWGGTPDSHTPSTSSTKNEKTTATSDTTATPESTSPSIPEAWSSMSSSSKITTTDSTPDNTTPDKEATIPTAWGGEPNPSEEDANNQKKLDYVSVGGLSVPVTRTEPIPEDKGPAGRILPWSDAPMAPATSITFDGIWGTIPFAQRISYPSTSKRGPGFSVKLPKNWTDTEAPHQILKGNNHVFQSPDPRMMVMITVFPMPDPADLKALISLHVNTLFSSYKARAGMEVLLGKQTGVGVFLEGIQEGEDVGCHFFLCRNKDKGYLIQAYYHDAQSARETASVLNTVRIF